MPECVSVCVSVCVMRVWVCVSVCMCVLVYTWWCVFMSMWLGPYVWVCFFLCERNGASQSMTSQHVHDHTNLCRLSGDLWQVCGCVWVCLFGDRHRQSLCVCVSLRYVCVWCRCMCYYVCVCVCVSMSYWVCRLFVFTGAAAIILQLQCGAFPWSMHMLSEWSGGKDRMEKQGRAEWYKTIEKQSDVGGQWQSAEEAAQRERYRKIQRQRLAGKQTQSC